MATFKFVTVRLGKDSIPDIQRICSSEVGILENTFIINVKCTQIPENYGKDDYAFIWLGSDNNKGMPTKWKQGFKAVGRIKNIIRGKYYNDTSETEIEILYIFDESINRMDILRCSPIAYYWCSSLPLIGLDDHANQTIRSMSGTTFADLSAFFSAIEAVTTRFRVDILKIEPRFKEYFGAQLPNPQDHPTAKNLEEITSLLVNNKKATSLQQIFYGAPGTGKSFAIEEQTKDEDVIRTTFHPDSDYSTFVGCYKPTTIDVPMRDVTGKVIVEKGEPVTEKRIVYEFVNQAFLQAYVGAWQKMAGDTTANPRKQYLVIEEINRGNCAQIFGDLFQLLDRNAQGFSEYPIKADADIKKQLNQQLSGLTITNADEINALYKGKNIVKEVLEGDVLLLPKNLYIWASMNTSDQSLFPIDSAFKRRWDWKYVPIANAEKNWVIEDKGKKYDWWDFLKKINALIGEMTNSEDKKLGYFFCKTETGIIDAETFVGKVIFYLWNDVFKDFEFEGDVFNDTEKDANGNTIKLTFDKFYYVDSNNKSAVRENKVDIFLTNLGVKFAQDEEDVFIPDEDDVASGSSGANDNSDGKDRSKYSINGQGSFNKRRLALECVKIYSSDHPNLTAQELVDVWMGMNLMRTNFIETSEVHVVRAESYQNDSHFNQRYYSYTLPNNNGTVYINNQFKVETINDFIEKVNAQDWGIHIEKVE